MELSSWTQQHCSENPDIPHMYVKKHPNITLSWGLHFHFFLVWGDSGCNQSKHKALKYQTAEMSLLKPTCELCRLWPGEAVECFWKIAAEWKHIIRGIVGVSKADMFSNTSVAVCDRKKTSWFVRVWRMRAGENKRKPIPSTDQTSPLVWRWTFNLHVHIGGGRMTNKPWFGIETFIYVTWRHERNNPHLLNPNKADAVNMRSLAGSEQAEPQPDPFWQIQTFCSNLGNQERLRF